MEEQIQAEAPTVTTKPCNKCGKSKLTSEFYKNSSAKDGLNAWCKLCIKRYTAVRDRATRKSKPSDQRKLKKLHHLGNPPKPVRKPQPQEPRITEDTGEKSKIKALAFYRNCFLGAYEQLTKLGLSEQTIKTIFGCSKNGLRSYTIYEKEGEEAYQRAMSELQAKLASHMVINAIGYDYQEEKICYTKEENAETGVNEWVEVRKEVFRKHHPGSSEQMIFFVTNRFPDKWKNSKELLTGKVQDYDETPATRHRKVIESQARDILTKNTQESETELPVQG